jgi:hypothetical protein
VGTKARTSNCVSAPAGCGATRPSFTSPRRAQSGFTASTSAALRSITAHQPGPLSTHWWPVMASRGRPQPATMRASSASSSGPLRLSGGAANARRPPSRRMRTSPTPHSCTTTPSCAGTPPAASQAAQLPSVGWPAKGSSPPGVKMRTR